MVNCQKNEVHEGMRVFSRDVRYKWRPLSCAYDMSVTKIRGWRIDYAANWSAWLSVESGIGADQPYSR